MAVLIGFAVVVGGLIVAIAYGIRWHRSNDPAFQRKERIADLRTVCDGTGVPDVPAYRQGATGQAGARFDLADDEDDADQRAVLAFPLVPGNAVDPDAVLDARLMACSSSRGVQEETCSFNDITRSPNFSGAGNVTASWTTLTTTELRIVDIHSGKMLERTTFDTPSECPETLRIHDDGSYDPTLPWAQIAEQIEAQVALFHQG